MYSIRIDSKIDCNSVHISKITLREANINGNKIYIHFGSLKKELQIIINNQIEANTIVIPSKINKEIKIPDLPYELYFKGNHGYLGPVIGYISSKKTKLNDTILRFSNYEKIKGLIYIFQEEMINSNNKTIDGYYYDPILQGFTKGTFPYPNAVYCRGALTSKAYKNLVDSIGNKIFNYPTNLDKLSLWRIMSKNSRIIKHLPCTCIYSSNKLHQMLDRYRSIYIKPTNKSGGRGILKVTTTNSKYILIDEFCDKYNFKTKEGLEKALRTKLSSKSQYLIQQEIPFSLGANKIDFRIYLQKDYSRKWKYSGMEAKIAKEGSIVSNSSYRMSMKSGEESLREIFGLEEKKAYGLLNKIITLCIDTLKTIEKNGYHLGDTAVDLIIDKNLRVWLLEVQLSYASLKKVSRSKEEKQVLPIILPTPFEYAKALAEF